jgi:hypothetical protein
MPEAFSDDEIKRLGQALASGGELACPRCGVPLDRRAVPPRSDVSYVRDRLWLTCPECHRAVVLDRR